MRSRESFVRQNHRPMGFCWNLITRKKLIKDFWFVRISRKLTTPNSLGKSPVVENAASFPSESCRRRVFMTLILDSRYSLRSTIHFSKLKVCASSRYNLPSISISYSSLTDRCAIAAHRTPAMAGESLKAQSKHWKPPRNYEFWCVQRVVHCSSYRGVLHPVRSRLDRGNAT